MDQDRSQTIDFDEFCDVFSRAAPMLPGGANPNIKEVGRGGGAGGRASDAQQNRGRPGGMGGGVGGGNNPRGGGAGMGGGGFGGR